MLKSPLNYTGGKYKLLPQLLPIFPKDIGTFVDLFCGGCNVGINVTADTVIYNDANERLICLYDTFMRLDKKRTFDMIYDIIDSYKLSLASEHGYAHYGCESGEGLASYNRDGFIKLREDFNARADKDEYYYIMLYVLIVYAFNNQIRFNSRGEFNLPAGKRDFNDSMAYKLSAFIDRIKAQNSVFTCEDFRAFDISALCDNDFVYVDPPYLITCATYNEQGGWSEADETALLDFLDALTARGIRFALSNVLRSKGKENHILLGWLQKNEGRYRAVPLDFSYANSNYHTRDRLSASEEVVVVSWAEKEYM